MSELQHTCVLSAVTIDGKPPDPCKACMKLYIEGKHWMQKVLPIPVLLECPKCHERHIDKGEFATRVHHTHACQHCGHVWRPAVVPTVGVQFLPGFKDEPDYDPFKGIEIHRGGRDGT